MERLTIDEVIAHCRRHTKNMEERATPLFFNEADLSSDMVKQYWEHKQVADWLEELKVRRAASKAPAIKMVEYEGEWVPEECCTFTNPLTSGGESYIDDAETPCSNCDQECSECVIQRVMDDYARVTGQAGGGYHAPKTMSDFVGNATVASSVFLGCGSTAEAVLKAASAANEKIKEMIRKNSPRQVKYMAELLGEKYECPECGSALTDEDLSAGHCKWCGQAIKDE